jgi:hypothetical protein
MFAQLLLDRSVWRVDERRAARRTDKHCRQSAVCIRRRKGHLQGMTILVSIFLLGIVNFALHKAVLASRHRLLDDLPAVLRRLDGRASLIAEFVLLLGAMLLVAYGHPGWGVGYIGYSVLNGVSAWAILTRRI